MKSGPATASLSRLEYFSGQVMTWVYIVLLASRLAVKTNEWPEAVLMLGAFVFLMSMVYCSWRERQAIAKAERQPPA